VRMHNNGGQSYFVATDHPDPEFVHPPELDQVYPFVQTEVTATFANVVEPSPDRGRVLTDDFNPVEFYDAQNREDLRRQIVQLVRQL
jgi:hypothetical protein